MEAGQFFCGVNEPLLENASVAKWQSGACSYCFVAYLAQIGREAQVKLTALAMSQWMSICGIRISKTVDPDTCNIRIGASRRGQDRQFDGRSGVLAYAGLPMPGTRQVPLMFDLDETWNTANPGFHALTDGVAQALGGTPTIFDIVAGIQYLAVARHEIGHAIGLAHAPSNVGPNIMAPIYDPAVTKFGEWEIAEAQRRYGKPAPTATPTQPPSDGVDIASMRILIGTERYKLVRE